MNRPQLVQIVSAIIAIVAAVGGMFVADTPDLLAAYLLGIVAGLFVGVTYVAAMKRHQRGV